MKNLVYGVKTIVLMLFLCAGSFGQNCEPASKCPSVEMIKQNLVKFGLKEIKRLTQAIKLAPSRADLYYRRGEIYRQIFAMFGPLMEYKNTVYERGTSEKALADFDKAIALNPRADYFASRAFHYNQIWDQALNESKFLERVQKGEKISWSEIDSVLFTNKGFEGAEKDYLEASKRAKTPYWQNVYQDSALKNIYHKVLYYTESESSSNRVISKALIESKKQTVLLSFWDKYINFIIARRAAQTEFKIEESEITGLYERKGIAASRLGEYKTANETFEKTWYLPAVPYGSALKSFEWGRALANLNLIDRAIGNVEAAANSINGSRFNVYLGDLYISKGDYRTAIAKYTLRIEKSTGDSFYKFTEDAYFKRGKAYLETGETEKAIADFSAAINENERCPQYFVFRAKAFRGLNKIESAESDEKTILNLEQKPETNVCRLDF